MIGLIAKSAEVKPDVQFQIAEVHDDRERDIRFQTRHTSRLEPHCRARPSRVADCGPGSGHWTPAVTPQRLHAFSSQATCQPRGERGGCQESVTAWWKSAELHRLNDGIRFSRRQQRVHRRRGPASKLSAPA